MRNYADHTSYANSFAPLPELAPPSPKAINAPALDSQPTAAAHIVHTIRNILAAPEKGVFDYISDDLDYNAKVSKMLYKLSDTTDSIYTFNTLERAAASIGNCSKEVLIQELPTKEAILKGRYRCRNKLCPACSKALQAKRRATAHKWLNDNAEMISRKYIYTAAFTLQHDQQNRNYDYSPELTGIWKKLRNDRKNRDWWNENVEGVLWGMEVTQKNDSPHIHLHTLLVSSKPLHTTDFKQELEDRWNEVSGGSYIVHLDRAYKPIYHEGGRYKGKSGKRYDKQYFEPGDDSADLIPVLLESLKYTVKFHQDDLNKLGAQFVSDWLNGKGRKYGTTGIFYGKGGIKPVTMKDVEDVEEDTDRKIKSPTTGQVFDKDEGMLYATAPENLEVRKVVGYADEETGEFTAIPHEVETIHVKDRSKLTHWYLATDWQKNCRMRFAPKNRNKNKPNLIQT